MKSLNNISNLYFVGIGGIGMSALARFALQEGKMVFGYDRVATSLTSELIQEGAKIEFEDEIATIPVEILQPENTLIVYTPAIPSTNRILNHFGSNGYPMMKRAQLLGEITEQTLCLAVAGTHGKTTTSAILGHILASCEMPVTAFFGGILENYNSNFLSRGNEISVVEADEFDRSFLKLAPDVACITSMDADHLDIYGDAAALSESFVAFSQLVDDKDKLFVKKGLPIEGRTVAINEKADYAAQNVRIENGQYIFDLHTPKQVIKDLKFSLPGHHNLLNAVTALGMAISAGTPTPSLPKALQSFKGVKRRFSYKIKSDHLVLIDDYAHHPTEINALHQAVEELFPEDRKLIVFQPHLFSRTRDFGDDFAESLSRFDEVLLLEIYPARELPIEGIDSNWLLKKIKTEKRLVSKTELAQFMLASKTRIKMIVGAGDIGAEVDHLTEILEHES